MEHNELKAKARFYFSEKLNRYKESGDRSDFGRVIDSIVEMGIKAGLQEAEEWCSLHCDADTKNCSVGLEEIIEKS